MRLIDADKLANEIRETYEYEFPTASGGFDEFVTKIIPNIIKNMETVDSVPVVHGYWTRYEVDVAEHPWHCSHCGWPPPKHVCHIEDMEYCSHCGTKMDDVDEAQRDYEMAVEMQKYCEQFEPTYNPEDGSM